MFFTKELIIVQPELFITNTPSNMVILFVKGML